MKHEPKTFHLKISSGSDRGFTLIELLLATAISAVVIGILSVCLSFTLRAWESTQNKKPDQSAAVVEMLKSQLSEFDPTPVQFAEGKHLLFNGQSTSLAFATSHSVKAISRGVPVIVRYIFDARSKVLLYAEIPFDPYHPDRIKEFLAMKTNTGEVSTVRFYQVGIEDFSFSYMGGEKTSNFTEKWDEQDKFPNTVLVNWKTQDTGGFSQAIEVNLPFTIETTQKQAMKAVGGQ